MSRDRCVFSIRTSHRMRRPSRELDRTRELYFQRMADTPLLTHEGEVALARRLERADLAIVRFLLASARGRSALADLAHHLRAKTTRVEGVERNPAPAVAEVDAAEELAARIEKLVAAAVRRPHRSRRRTRPRAGGLRLDPRVV